MENWNVTVQNAGHLKEDVKVQCELAAQNSTKCWTSHILLK
jgi:hypothetical protein